jgi:hypothetical protein
VTVFIAAMPALSRNQKRKNHKLERGRKQWRTGKGQARKANRQNFLETRAVDSESIASLRAFAVVSRDAVWQARFHLAASRLQERT